MDLNDDGRTVERAESRAGLATAADLPVIPFNKPSLAGHELDLMQAAVEGGHSSAAGPYSELTAALLRDEMGAAEVFMTTSCTAALEMSALLLELEPGDTVVVPSFGFVTTALAFVNHGARVLFCDIERDRLGLDPEHLAELMDDSVRAVVPIHYAGVACDVDGIRQVLAAWPRAELVEDNAHGLFASSAGRPLGSFGRFASLSFHETKNFVCGEGGALIVNDPADAERAHIVYHKGTNRQAFMLGMVDKYSWVDVGSSFGLADVLAAFLYGQLEQRDVILGKRQRAFDRYDELLRPLRERFDLQLPNVPAACEQAYHMYYLLLPDRAQRDAVLSHMQGQGIYSTFHYVPLHSAPGGRRFAARPIDCPVTDEISGRLLRLPFYTSLTEQESARVVNTLVAALEEVADR